MIAYEVTAVVDRELLNSFEDYMQNEHIPDVLATGCFVSAAFSRSADRYQIRYESETPELFERYLAEHAIRLRNESQLRFPAGIEFSREVWTEIARLKPS